jgi:GH25 family lysozyme M1 (1,4-beta-N-acetylmuramidase)
MLVAGLDLEELKDYDVWLSDESIPTDYPYKFSMWQYNKKGSIDGITGDIDLDMCFINYEQK